MSLAQSQSSTADLLGRVTDATGSVLAGVTVTTESSETELVRKAFTSRDGSYRMPLLRPGIYEVRFELDGFSTKIFRGIRLAVGQYADLSPQMELASFDNEVVVTENAS